MKLELKKAFTLYSVYFFVFCIGLENAIVVPTILEYLHLIGIQNAVVLGISFACYASFNSLSAQVLRHLVNASYSMKFIMLACCLCYISGGFLYSFGSSWWGVVLSRSFCGAGSGAFAAMNADISSSILGEELSILQWRSYISLLLGMVSAPLFACLFDSLSTGPFNLPSGAIPGILCSSIFLASSLLALSGFLNLGRTLRLCRLRQSLSLAYERTSVSSRKSYGAVAAPEFDQIGDGSENSNTGIARIIGLWSSHNSASSSTSSSARPSLEMAGSNLSSRANSLHRVETALTHSDEMLETAECLMGEPDAPLIAAGKASQAKQHQTQRTLQSTEAIDREQQLSEPDIHQSVLGMGACYDNGCTFWERSNWLGPHFLAAFLLGCIQTMLTPLTAIFFMFGGTENAVIQLVLGLVGVVPLLVLRKYEIPRKVVLLSGCLMASVALGWMIILCPTFAKGDLSNLPSFSAGFLSLALSCGLVYASCRQDDALVYKRSTEPPEWAWVWGLVLGPLWSGSTAGQPRLLLGGQLALVLLGTASNLF